MANKDLTAENEKDTIEVKVPEDSAIINESEEDEETTDENDELNEEGSEKEQDEEDSDDSKWYDELKAKLNLTDAEENEVSETLVEYPVEDFNDIINTLSSDLEINLHDDFDGKTITADYNNIEITVSIAEPMKISLSIGDDTADTEEAEEEEGTEEPESEEESQTEEETADENIEESKEKNSDDDYEEVNFADYVQGMSYKSPTTFKVKK